MSWQAQYIDNNMNVQSMKKDHLMGIVIFLQL